ncbi:MAG: four helix bundle protein [Deltaproteobacteria bacterium]|nr:four helix bundle protein [Deltaproteobacteria bacterium]
MLAYERLDVYRSSIELFALCARAINHFPKGNHVLADQLRRAALSIPLNVADGSGQIRRDGPQALLPDSLKVQLWNAGP